MSPSVPAHGPAHRAGADEASAEDSIPGNDMESRAPVGELTLPAALERAARANPTLRAAEESRRAAEDRRPQASAWPDATLSLGVFAQPIETRVGEQRWTLGIQQPLPWPGVLDLRGERAELGVGLAGLEFEMRARDMVVEVVTAYWELLYLRGALEIQGETLAIAEELRARTSGEPAGVTASLPDQARTGVWLAELEFDGELLRELIGVEEERLRALLDLPSSTEVRPAPMPELPGFDANLEEIVDRAHDHSLEIRRAELRLLDGELGAEETALASRPDLRLGARYIGVEAYDFANPSGNGDDALAFELGFSLPGLNGRAAAAERESRHVTIQRRFERDAVLNSLRASLAKDLFGVRNSDRLRRLYREALTPRAERTAYATLGLFEAGEAPFGSVLEAFSGWHHERLAALRAEADYAQALARLEGRVGAPFELRPIDPAEPEDPR